MEEEPHPYMLALVMLGLSTGVCIGAILTMLCNPPQEVKTVNLTPIHKLIHAQRDSLRNLRTDFNSFRTSHERELMSIVRETLRVSPRSVVSEEPSGQTE